MSALRTRAKTIAAFAASWVAFGAIARDRVGFLNDWVYTAITRVLSGYPALVNYAHHAWPAVRDTSMLTFMVGLWLGTVAWSLGFLVRMIARARVRSGARDFLEPVRAWTRAHPKWTAAITSVPALIWALGFTVAYPVYNAYVPKTVLVMAILNGLGMAWWSRFSARALLAPTLADNASSRFEIGPDEIVFDAVAVTLETKAAVLALFALTVATVLLLGSRPIDSLYHGAMPLELMLGYTAIAVGSATAFRLASRVAVGLDGVHVRGTSRAKFFAYRDLDAVRTKGSDLELVRRGRVVLRLQLHGEDASRRDAVLARISEHIARVKEGRGATTAGLVSSATKETLERVAHGGADYRMAAVTREELWALVEGPEIEASARRAAAEALVKSSGEAERARLRVAAERCAEPQVRVALEEIARGEEIEGGTEGRRGAAT
ncbi:MAG: hypothetical protein ACLQBL_40795 [Polyangiaceae bacterium]